MLAGKWITKMFEPNNYQTNQVVIDYDKNSYEFISELFFETFAKIIKNYFSKVSKDINYTYSGNGKVLV
jgi:hypothetical protein